MNLAISFSARKGGNCDQIANYLISSTVGKVLYFRDLSVHECSNCEYQCFGGQCIYRDDDAFPLYDCLTDFDRVYFVIPIYCGNPPSIYFKFAERAQDYFSKFPHKYEEIIKKLYIVAVCGLESDDKDFIRLLDRYFDFTSYKNRVLAIERHRYGLKLNEWVLEVEQVKSQLDEFLSRKLEINYNETELRKPCERDIDEIIAFKNEFLSTGDSMDGSGLLDSYEPIEWLNNNAKMELIEDPNISKSLQMGLFERKSGRLIGLIQLRTQLKGYLIEFGGNIGYCIRPSERNKGYAKFMLSKMLEICTALKMKRVLITCLEDNLASAKVIESNGGKLEKVVFDGVNYKKNVKRFWIEL